MKPENEIMEITAAQLVLIMYLCIYLGQKLPVANTGDLLEYFVRTEGKINVETLCRL